MCFRLHLIVLNTWHSLLQYLQFIGACWYLLAIERKDACWRQQCGNSTASAIPCQFNYLYCSARDATSEWQAWQNSTTIFDNCQSDSALFDFGIYKNAFDKHILDSNFVKKYLYCLWFGLQQLRYTKTIIYEKIYKNLCQKVCVCNSNVFLHNKVMCLLIYLASSSTESY